jgi:hypothetical protein
MKVFQERHKSQEVVSKKDTVLTKIRKILESTFSESGTSSLKRILSYQGMIRFDRKIYFHIITKNIRN